MLHNYKQKTQMTVDNSLLLIKIILADKLRLHTSDISDTAKLEDLVKGNSAVQNEIMGTLLKELRLKEADADKIPELPLMQVASMYPVAGFGKFMEKKRSQLLQKNFSGKLADIEKLFEEENLKSDCSLALKFLNSSLQTILQ